MGRSLRGSLALVSVVLTSATYRPAPLAREAARRLTAIVGATVIDGTGAPPRADATVLLEGRTIKAVGARAQLTVPTGATVIDGRGLFVLPGFIDLNVHITGEGAREALQHGITTVHNTWWGGNPEQLPTQRALRDSIRAGAVDGPRLLFSHEILGWGESEVGESLTTVGLDSLRARVNRYLDTGVDFVKYGATDHGSLGGLTMVFSPEAQRVIVEEAHKRGLPVEVHAHTAEAKRAALLAGVDLVQHPEVQLQPGVPASEMNEPLSDAMVQLFLRQGAACALITGRPDGMPPSRPDTSAQWRVWNANRRQLIKAGCPIVPVSDALEGMVGLPGVPSLHAIEELVVLGMTPMEALIAATRTAARVARLDSVGTVEAGKLADLVVLKADPLVDIANIEQLALVFAEGRRVSLVPHTDD